MTNLMNYNQITQENTPYNQLDIENFCNFQTPQPQSSLNYLLQKFLNGQIVNDLQLQKLPENDRILFLQLKQKKENQLKQSKSKITKRPDELRKCFFRKAFNYIQKRFYNKKNKIRKLRRSNLFYKHYFEQVSNYLGIELQYFHNPDHINIKKVKKTFSMQFINLIMKSTIFRNETKNYAKYQFLQDCIQQRRHKINKLIINMKFKQIYNQNDCATNFKNYLMSNKTKIPWTTLQLLHAKNISLQIINSKQQQSEET